MTDDEIVVAAVVAVTLRLVVFLSGGAAGRRTELNIERFVDPT